MKNSFHRIAIIGRGLSAIRFIEAVREYNLESGSNIRTVVFYTEPERNINEVLAADIAILIEGEDSWNPYTAQPSTGRFDYTILMTQLKKAGVDAVWVGENKPGNTPEFADRCARKGIVFFGPPAQVLENLLDSAISETMAKKAGIPLRHPDKTTDNANTNFSQQGYRQVDVLIIGDAFGRVYSLGVIGNTLRPDHGPNLLACPASFLPKETMEAIQQDTVIFCEIAGFQGVGMVHFQVDPGTGKYYYDGISPWLQQAYVLIEMTTGWNLVKWQLYVAMGRKLPNRPPVIRGHALSVDLRVDTGSQLKKVPVKILYFSGSNLPGSRFDRAGTNEARHPILLGADICRLSVIGADRSEALAKLKSALLQTRIVLNNGISNKRALLNMLENAGLDPDALASAAAGENPDYTFNYARIALLQAAIETYRIAQEAAKEHFVAMAQRGRPEVKMAGGCKAELVYEGQKYEIHTLRTGLVRYRMVVDGTTIDLHVEAMGKGNWKITSGQEVFHVFSYPSGDNFFVEVNGMPYHLSRFQGLIVRAPAPAVVSNILLEKGSEVKTGDPMIVLEAMKMETTLLAEFQGKVTEIRVHNHQQVDTGTPLMFLEPLQQQGAQPVDRLDFSSFDTQVPEGDFLREWGERLKCLFKGFDADAVYLAQMIRQHKQAYERTEGEEAEVWEWENEMLEIFTDTVSLFRRESSQPDTEDVIRLSSEEYLYRFVADVETGKGRLPKSFLSKLEKSAAYYGVENLHVDKPLIMSLFRMFKAFKRMPGLINFIIRILERKLEISRTDREGHEKEQEFSAVLNRLIEASRRRFPAVHDLAIELRYEYFDRPLFQRIKNEVYDKVERWIDRLAAHPEEAECKAIIQHLVDCPQTIKGILIHRFQQADEILKRYILEALTRKYYRIREIEDITFIPVDDMYILSGSYPYQGKHIRVVALHSKLSRFSERAAQVATFIHKLPEDDDIVIDFYVHQGENLQDKDAVRALLLGTLIETEFNRPVRRIVVSTSEPETRVGMRGLNIFTFRQHPDGFVEEVVYGGLHPMMAKRLEMWQLAAFDLERIPSVKDVYLFKAIAKQNSKDVRLFAFAEVRDLSLVGGENEQEKRLPYLETMLNDTAAEIRKYLAHLPVRQRPFWNRIMLYLWPEVDLENQTQLIRRLAPVTEGLGLEKVSIMARVRQNGQPDAERIIMDIRSPEDVEIISSRSPKFNSPIRPLSEYDQKVVQAARSRLHYPYELIQMICPRPGQKSPFPQGEFSEYDLNEDNELVEVDRPFGQNASNIVVGLIRNITEKYPEGMLRVAILGDSSRGMGNLSEPECRLIIAGLDLAAARKVPVEWYAVSAGAKISMESGTENMDWIAFVLRRIIDFTQKGGEIHVIVTGINVGAQPYWNAEATMLMHTKGILVMTPEVAMVLTGKQSLDYSGGVSAEDNIGIGGYERIMGPNGQAQYLAANTSEACQILFRYYDYTYRLPEERIPRRRDIEDPFDRDIQAYPHGGIFQTVGEIFSERINPERKKPYNIRKVMESVIDRDYPPLERWKDMADAEMAVVWDASLGGYPVCMIGIESHPIPRVGMVPADGPRDWTGGTLFPMASKKIARAINSASGNRSLVVMANLSGFDGSPESLRRWQLEFGAEIGRAVVNFRGPVVLCVVSRYHGGAFVVFSNKLNDNMQVIAIEGAYASVIGGAPASAVVFPRLIVNKTLESPEIRSLDQQIAVSRGAEGGKLKAQREKLYESTYVEKQGQLAETFDRIHNIQRAKAVGSVDHIIAPEQVRPFLIQTIERGIRKEKEMT